MNKFTLLLMILAFGCAEVEQTISPYDEAWKFDQTVLMEQPYTLGFELDETKDGTPLLVLTMTLADGAFYVSPHSSSRFTGRFGVSFYDTDKVVLDSAFVEIPRSPMVYDAHGFVGGEVNWVKNSTRYEYPLHVHSQEDFKVNGLVSFTIEPRCTFEQVPFDLMMEDGKLRIQHYPKLENGKCETNVQSGLTEQ